MERLENNRRNYVKPVTSRFELDKNICDDMCGMLGAIVTSTSEYQQYKICVHFPTDLKISKNETVKTYSSQGGTVRKITVRGKHIIEFAGGDSGVDCNISGTTSSGARYGCGWKQYETNNNGNCHYFGVIKVDGVAITENGTLPSGVSENW